MEALGAGAVVSVAGAQLFNYNRGNFRYDSQLRFKRFQSQREYAILQTNQYGNDIRKLTELTVKKMSSYHMTGCPIIAVNIALFCAGHLGLHGTSPPGWIMGLFLTNNAASLGFLATAVWLVLHASQRATAASMHLLTRKVRVPVPTKKQLYMTRKLSSDFEQQSWSDMFRVPYLMKGSDTVPDLEVDDPRTNYARTLPLCLVVSVWPQVGRGSMALSSAAQPPARPCLTCLTPARAFLVAGSFLSSL